jgi:hypothetical protein
MVLIQLVARISYHSQCLTEGTIFTMVTCLYASFFPNDALKLKHLHCARSISQCSESMSQHIHKPTQLLVQSPHHIRVSYEAQESYQADFDPKAHIKLIHSPDIFA